jgi:hypothetical protein
MVHLDIATILPTHHLIPRLAPDSTVVADHVEVIPAEDLHLVGEILVAFSGIPAALHKVPEATALQPMIRVAVDKVPLRVPAMRLITV